MNEAGQYILSVGLAALTVGILTSLTDSKTATGTLIRMVCGLFLAFTVIKPVAGLNFDYLEAFAQSYSEAGEASAAMGETLANEALREIIKREAEAYILDKAGSYQCELSVEVSVGNGDVPVPESVRISGNVSPYARSQLQKLLEDELGIPKEQQLWIG